MIKLQQQMPPLVTTDLQTQSFTMDIMLESLNVPLDVIGYDKRNQRWYD